jgi:hypothetical protein
VSTHTEHDWRYEGWRVTAAAAAGVFVSFASLLVYLTWTAYAFAGAIGPILMGKAFDATGSYERLLLLLALTTLASAVLMLLTPPYPDARADSSAETSTPSVSRPSPSGTITAGTISPVDAQRNTTSSV